MISKLVGKIWKKNTKTNEQWIRLGVALVLSNIFFFLLFGGPADTPTEIDKTPIGQVEVQLRAELSTPFQKGKKITLFHRPSSQVIPGVLQADLDQEGKITLRVSEKDAGEIFVKGPWEVLPPISSLPLPKKRGETHEIRY